MKNGYLSRWAKAAGVRALKTMAQTAVATVGTSTIISTVDWKVVASASVVAGLLSLLTSVAGLPEVEE
jgi:phage membrane protein|nr:MAG TPA: holin [Caudoviricetes sp.]